MRQREEAAYQPSSDPVLGGPLGWPGEEAPTMLTLAPLCLFELLWPCRHGEGKSQRPASTHTTVPEPPPVGTPFWTLGCSVWAVLSPASCSFRMAWGHRGQS